MIFAGGAQSDYAMHSWSSKMVSTTNNTYYIMLELMKKAILLLIVTLKTFIKQTIIENSSQMTTVYGNP